MICAKYPIDFRVVLHILYTSIKFAILFSYLDSPGLLYCHISKHDIINISRLMINIPCRRAQVNSHVVPKRAAVEEGMQTDSRETGEWDGPNGPVPMARFVSLWYYV